MKYYEYLVTFNRPTGIQSAYAYVNAAGKRAAKKAISSLPIDIISHRLDGEYPERPMAKGVKLWYFDESGQEHDEIY